MNTISDYHDLYLKALVLLLADDFEKFINTCLEISWLDPCHYFSSPGLSCDAILKITEKELELITNIGMHLFIEKGMREGISYIAKRHSKANNKFMQWYDVNEPNTFIVYLDADNLYGWAMGQYLRYNGFKWLNQKEIDKFYLNSIECNFIEENSSDGYILEVVLGYSNGLHELHNDYLLAPEKP